MKDFIQNVAREAGEETMKYFGSITAHHHKSESRTDALTHADLASEKIIIDAIKAAYPDHGFISEEAGSLNPDAEYVWIIDPIDGTLNFASGVPLYGVMIALARNKEVIMSAVYMPVTDEMMFAEKGKGAYLNGELMHCSDVMELGKAIGCIPSKGGVSRKFLRRLLDEVEGTNALFNAYGCIAANCRYIAAGTRDWVVTISGELHDYAPTVLILQESGCVVTGFDGNPWTMESRGIIAANPILHEKLEKIVAEIR